MTAIELMDAIQEFIAEQDATDAVIVEALEMCLDVARDEEEG